MSEQHLHCLKEHEWGQLMADLEYIKKAVATHVFEGDKPGGFRDRLVVLEQQHAVITEKTLEQCGVLKEKIKEQNERIDKIKLGYIWAGILGGVIGGLISTAAPEFFIILGKVIKAIIPLM